MSERDAVSTEIKSWGPGAETASKRGITVKRLFTKAGGHPFDEIEWEMRTASIQNDKGKVIFEQRNVEVPKDWTQTATNIVASKYFHGKLGTPERESSVRQLISRVADTIAQWGVEGGYFPQRGRRQGLFTTN
jgi:ribonucleoside-diphosphate reductase alpha chain